MARCSQQKIDQVLALCSRLNAENAALRDRVAGLENDKRDLTERIGSARTRLETLMTKLPEE